MLQKITFTGIDKQTDIDHLCEFVQEYPKAEFGFLALLEHQSKGNRYCSPSVLQRYRGRGLPLSLHVCGTLNDRLLQTGDWDEIKRFVGDDFSLFSRIQLNIAKRFVQTEDWKIVVPQGISEIIIQQRCNEDMPMYEWCLTQKPEIRAGFTVLLDASGGRGKYDGAPATAALPYAGYAGGFKPDNVLEAVLELETSPNVQDYWIDMESGIRTKRDWFSIELCQKVCEQLKGF